MNDALVTLLTDFGNTDVYVGVMKGTMLAVNPRVRWVDLSHQVPPQDCRTGGFQLLQALPYFPPQTVHLVVIDPGVGTSRRAIALKLGIGYCIGPDNGVFTHVLHRYPVEIAVELNRPQFWRHPNPSATFHGRDIFAPVAAHLAAGVPLLTLGTPLDPNSLMRLPQLDYQVTPEGVRGWVQAIDHFGNVITTLPAALLHGCQGVVEIAGHRVALVNTYGDRPCGSCLALVGSHGFIEVAVNGGSAEKVLGCRNGDTVCLL
ncbi:SAM hydrolase/SAM-dependent halogenase family protein [Parathermosynechococcus lividus]